MGEIHVDDQESVQKRWEFRVADCTFCPTDYDYMEDYDALNQCFYKCVCNGFCEKELDGKNRSKCLGLCAKIEIYQENPEVIDDCDYLAYSYQYIEVMGCLYNRVCTSVCKKILYPNAGKDLDFCLYLCEFTFVVILKETSVSFPCF